MAKIVVNVSLKGVGPGANIQAIAADIRTTVSNITGMPASVSVKDDSSMSTMDARFIMDRINGNRTV